MSIFTDFCALVSTEINLGTTHDAVIPNKVKQAVKMIERTLTLPYMKRELSLSLAAAATSTPLSTLMGTLSINQLKKITYFGLPLDTGKIKWLDRIEALDIAEIDDLDLPPSGYWQKGMSTIYFDRELNQAYTARVGVVVYTDPAGLAADVTTTDLTEDTISYHWLIKNAERALVLMTLICMSSTIREPELAIMWKNEMFGTGEAPAEAGSEWNTLVQYAEEEAQSNADLNMNPFRDKASA